jgi:RNA polymerase sigma-70 factor (ECF subfamily)
MHATHHADRCDEFLMALYAQGDGQAFDALFARYESRAYGFILRRIRSESRAADLYQELFLRIHRARASYDPSRPFAPWFFQIARRLVIDELRRCGRRQEEALEEERAPGFAMDSSGEAEPERHAACHEQAQAVLGELSEVERYVLVSAKVEGRGYAELAAELGKSVVAIKKLASRAMQRLRAAQESTVGTALPAQS